MDDEKWNNFIPEVFREDAPKPENSIIIKITCAFIAFVVISGASLMILNNEIKKDNARKLKAEVEQALEEIADNINKKTQPAQIQKTIVYRPKKTVKPKAKESKPIKWVSMKSDPAKGNKPISECNRADGVINNQVIRCIKGEINKTWD